MNRLLVITEERPAEILAKGFDREYLSRYYNPRGAFAEFRLFDWGAATDAWPAEKQLRVERSREIDAWLASLATADRDKPLDASVGFPGLPAAWVQAAREFAPDCIRAYGTRWSALAAREFARALGVPLLVSAHNTRELGLLGDIDVMAVSDETARACISAGANPARVVTVPNRVDRQIFKAGAPAPDSPSDGEPKLLCIARDVEQKNLDRLLAACEIARKKLPRLKLVHIGHSTRDWGKHSFATHIASVPHDQLPRWYGWADVFVLPSLWEGFGIVLIEALACGTPCLAANRAPMNELIHDRWDGLLFDPEKPDDIARAIGEIAQPDLRARLAAAARTASEPYDIAAVETREAALYRNLLSNQTPLISVVLPTYNRGRLIESAVRNALAQDYPNLELIVVNDGSKDNTREILDRLVGTRGSVSGAEDTLPRVPTVIHKENGGLPAALNTGFEAARGELLTWTSDDNAFRPGALSAMARELALDPDAGMVFADYQMFDAAGKAGSVVTTGPVSELTTRNVIGACFLYRREIARSVGTYDISRELAEDYDYWLRISRAGKIIHLNRILYDYGDTPDSLTNRRGAEVAAATYRLNEREGMDEGALRGQLSRLAGEYKTRGMPLRSLGAAAKLISRWPLSGAGYWAFARALVPLAILKIGRRARGADA